MEDNCLFFAMPNINVRIYSFFCSCKACHFKMPNVIKCYLYHINLNFKNETFLKLWIFFFAVTQGRQAGDNFVESSILNAIQKVDSAINSTRRHLFSQ